MKLFEYKGKDVEIFTFLNWKEYLKAREKSEGDPWLIGRGEMYYDCPHIYYNCLFFQIWISGF